MRSTTVAAAMLWVGAAVAPAWAGTITISDTTFTPGHWNAPSGPARSPWSIWTSASQTTSATQSSVSGSPALVLTHTLRSSGNAGGAIINNTASYTPSVSGAIGTLDYSISQQWQAPFDLPWRLAIAQNGKYYGTVSYHRAFEDGVPSGTYKTFTGTNLTAASFAEQLTDFGMDPLSRPDFGPTGSTMYFGLIYLSFTSIPSGFTWTTYYGRYDVVLRTASSVPEIDPAGCGAIAAVLAGCGALLERRRMRG